MKRLLIIGHTYPEPSTTAAGGRMLQLIELFKKQEYVISFATTAILTERSAKLDNVDVHSIRLNCSSFDKFISELRPSVVIFDRYITEEQFGWRVSKFCESTLRILDTEDLHFLRDARETAFKNNLPVLEANVFTEMAKREIASILRCDLSLIISKFEMDLLIHKFNVPTSLLHYLPFLIDNFSNEKINDFPAFEDRTNFMTIGNLLHKPNVDSINYLKNKIWPLIKKQLPDAKLFIYGAYAPLYINDLHNEKEGFIVAGWCEDKDKLMQKARICLAPLRFGAGLKGKLIDAMLNGLPSVTTSIGAEGMHGDLSYSGRIADSAKGISEAAIQLYSDKNEWLRARDNGFRILKECFSKEIHSKLFLETLENIQKDLIKHRTENFIGQILNHHTLMSTKYLSKWISEKNKSVNS